MFFFPYFLILNLSSCLLVRCDLKDFFLSFKVRCRHTYLSLSWQKHVSPHFSPNFLLGQGSHLEPSDVNPNSHSEKKFFFFMEEKCFVYLLLPIEQIKDKKSIISNGNKMNMYKGTFVAWSLVFTKSRHKQMNGRHLLLAMPDFMHYVEGLTVNFEINTNNYSAVSLLFVLFFAVHVLK